MFIKNKQFGMIFTFNVCTANDTAYYGTDREGVYNNSKVLDVHIFLD